MAPGWSLIRTRRYVWQIKALHYLMYIIYIYNLNYFCLLGSVYKIVSVNGLNYGYFLKTRWEQKICKFINEQYFSKKV